MNAGQKNQQGIQRIAEYLLFALPLFVAFILYGYTVRLSFFLDDGAHFDILAQTHGLEFWGKFPTFPFYRPLVFTIWQGYERLTGSYDPVALHYFNVLCFSLAGVLCGRVTGRLAPDSIRFPVSILAGLLFVVFPFSYQAVAMVAALFHLTLTFGIMLSLWAGLNWLDDPRRPMMLLLAWGGAFIAIFSHENGVLIVPLWIVVVLISQQRNPFTRRNIMRLLVPICIMALAYLWQWWRVRPQDATQINNAIDVSMAVLLQGLVYPVASLLRPLIAGDIDPIFLIGIAFLTVAVSVFVFYRYFVAYFPLLLFGFGWYVAAITPAVLFLSAGYVLGQTRLALFASLGGSMFWALVIATLWRHERRWIKVLAVACVVLFVYVSVEFLAMRKAEFLQLASYQRNVLAQFETLNVDDANTVVVNAPDFLIPQEHDRRFLIATEGVLFVDPAADYGLQWTINAPQNYRDVNVIAFPDIQRNAGFGFSAHPPILGRDAVVERVRDADYVFVTEFEDHDFDAVLVGGNLFEAPENDIDARLAQGDFELSAAVAEYNGDTIEVRSQWIVNRPDAVKLFVHVYCGDEFIAQSDGYPWGDTYPFSFWATGETQTDSRRIQLEQPVTRDCLQIYIGLYYEADVTRLEAFDGATGEYFENDQIPLDIIED